MASSWRGRPSPAARSQIPDTSRSWRSYTSLTLSSVMAPPRSAKGAQRAPGPTGRHSPGATGGVVCGRPERLQEVTMTDTPSDRPPYPPQPGQDPPGGYPPAGQAPAGGYPTAGYPAARPRRNGMGTTALVLGVVALTLVLLLLFSPLGAFLGLLAVVFGILGLMRANPGEADNPGPAV